MLLPRTHPHTVSLPHTLRKALSGEQSLEEALHPCPLNPCALKEMILTQHLFVILTHMCGEKKETRGREHGITKQINNMLCSYFNSPLPLNNNSHPFTIIHCAFHNSMPTADYPLIHSHGDQWCWSPLTAKSAHITHSSSLWSWLQPFFFCTASPWELGEYLS